MLKYSDIFLKLKLFISCQLSKYFAFSVINWLIFKIFQEILIILAELISYSS